MAAIDKLMEDWRKHLKGELEGGIDTLLTDDVVFYSPIVYSPQKGRDLTKMYLSAAGSTFDVKEADPFNAKEGEFKYSKEVLCGNHAVLEFETEVGGKYVNGVDIITCNDEGKITEFKVMIRPLQAVNMMHQQMAARIKKMQG